jgi:hypothetical protein
MVNSSRNPILILFLLNTETTTATDKTRVAIKKQCRQKVIRLTRTSSATADGTELCCEFQR